MQRLLPLLVILLATAAGTAYFLTRETPERAETVAVESVRDAREDAMRTDALHEPTAPDAAELQGSEEPDDARRLVHPAPGEQGDWIEGTVVVPQGTPSEEFGVWVLPTDRAMNATAWKYVLRHGRDGLHRVAVQDGRFRFRRSPSGRTCLWIDSDWLYLEETVVVSSDAAPVLEPQLGACIEVSLRPPIGEPADTVLAGMECELTGFAYSIDQKTWIKDPGSKRTSELDESGVARFGALPPSLEWSASAEPVDWLPLSTERIAATAGTVTRRELQFQSGATLSGIVVDEQGAPIAGAVVSWGDWSHGSDLSDAVAHGEADEDGHFELNGLAPRRGVLMAHAEGYLSLGLERMLVEADQVVDRLEIRLPSGATVSGIVYGPDGEPLANAEVMADVVPDTMRGDGNAWGKWSDTSRSDEEGRFKLGGMLDGLFVVYAKAPGKDGATLRATEVDVPGGDESLELHLAPPPGLSVRLVIEGDGRASQIALAARPLSAAEGLQFAPFDLDPAERAGLRSAAPDAAGVYVFPAAWLADYEITIETPGYSLRERPTIVTNDGVSVVNVEMTASTRIAGRVLDPTGNPVASAEVQIGESSEQDVPRFLREGFNESTRTDERGRFHFDEVGQGSYQLSAAHERFAESEAVSVDCANGESHEDLIVTLRESGSVHGVLLDDDDRPVPGRTIQLSHRLGGMTEQSTSDENGGFRFEHVTPGPYHVAAVPDDPSDDPTAPEPTPGDYFGQLEFTLIDVAAGAVTEVVLGAASESAVRIHGTVTRAGAPVTTGTVFVVRLEDAVIDVDAADVTDSGHYELEVETPGDAQFIYSDDGGRTNEFQAVTTIPAGEDWRFDIDLPTGTVFGRLLGAEDEPLHNRYVGLTRRSGPAGAFGLPEVRQVVTNREGRFRFDGLVTGTYDLRVSGEGLDFAYEPEYAAKVTRGIEVVEGREAEELVIRLDIASSITGRVIDVNGAPVHRAALFARYPDGTLLHELSTTQSAANGRFDFGHLPPGELWIEARTSTAASARIAVTVESGDSVNTELRVAPATRLHVLIEDSTGISDHARLSVVDAAGFEYAGMSAEFDLMFPSTNETPGRLVGPLPPGTYRIVADDASGRRAEREVTVDGEPERELNLLLSDD